jgi:hypothetical protein
MIGGRSRVWSGGVGGIRKVKSDIGVPTAKLCRSVVSGVTGLAVHSGPLDANPVREIRRIEQGRKRKLPRSLTIDEIEFTHQVKPDIVLCGSVVDSAGAGSTASETHRRSSAHRGRTQEQSSVDTGSGSLSPSSNEERTRRQRSSPSPDRRPSQGRPSSRGTALNQHDVDLLTPHRTTLELRRDLGSAMTWFGITSASCSNHHSHRRVSNSPCHGSAPDTRSVATRITSLGRSLYIPNLAPMSSSAPLF